MAQLPQLIPYEEIYDLDVFQLEEMQTQIKQQNTDDAQWIKKAKKILDLIEVELKERQAIENFACNIQFEDFIQQPIYQNNALQAILNDIKNRPANYLDVQFQKPPLPKQEHQEKQPKITQEIPKKINEQPTQSTNFQTYQKPPQTVSHQSDTMSNSTMTRSTNGRQQQPKKPNQMQEFMQNVLKKTDVTNQQFVIGAGVNHRYVPPPPKPQLTTVEKIKQDKLKKKKKKKGRTESVGKVVDHLPAINQQSNTKQLTLQKMEQSNVLSQNGASNKNFEIQQKNLDGQLNFSGKKNDQLTENIMKNSKIQNHELKNDSQLSKVMAEQIISNNENKNQIQVDQQEQIQNNNSNQYSNQQNEFLELSKVSQKKEIKTESNIQESNQNKSNSISANIKQNYEIEQQNQSQQVTHQTPNIQSEKQTVDIDYSKKHLDFNNTQDSQQGQTQQNVYQNEIKYSNKHNSERSTLVQGSLEQPDNAEALNAQENNKSTEIPIFLRAGAQIINENQESKQKTLENQQNTQSEIQKKIIQNHYNYVLNEMNEELEGNTKNQYLTQVKNLQHKKQKDDQEEYEDNFNEYENENDEEDIKAKQNQDSSKRNSQTNFIQGNNKNETKQSKQLPQQQANKSKGTQETTSRLDKKSQQSMRKQENQSKASTKGGSIASVQSQKGKSQTVQEIKKQEEEEEIVEDFNEVESDHEPAVPQKHKPLKELVGKVIGRSDQPKYKGVIEVKQKPVLTDKEKLEEINNICKDMGLEDFKSKQQPQPQPQPVAQVTKAITPSQNNRPKNPQSKYIIKMMQFIDDSQLVDYSDIVPTFQHLFSGFFNNQAHYNHLDVMREIYGIFQQHIEKVDNVETMLGKYKSNPLAINPNELVYINDPHRLIQYSTKTGVDIQQYIQRQMVFNKRLQNDNSTLGKLERYFRVVKTKEEVYDIITRSFMRKQGWTELAHGIGLRTSWNVLWTWSKPQIDLNKLLLFQKVNHFPFNKNLGRKDLLKKNIERCQRLGAKAASIFDIIPATFLLPKEYVQFMEKFYKDSETEGQHNIWIMKPTGKSRGRGITVLNDISDVMYAEPVVLQKYLKNPLLLKGHKFDMRIYVLVTSFNPLEVFLYREGFARLTTQPFTLDINDLKNQLIHLTNFAVQKTHVQIQDLEQQLGGCKISLRQLREKLIDKNVDWNKIWEQVQDIILKSLVACQSEIPNNPNSFELFGYDIIIDTNHKCWLLEVNASPSLARDYILDELIKQQLIDDIFDLLDSPNYDRQRLCEVLERRIQEEQGCKSVINTMNNSKLQLQRDLNYILNGQHLRRYGEMPKNMGGFMRLAPSEKYDKLKALVQSYKTINGRGTID